MDDGEYFLSRYWRGQNDFSASDAVDHPGHYGGEGNPYEAIKVIEAWGLGFNLGNAIKYIARAGSKPGTTRYEDLRKARWYLDREIAGETR